MQSNLGHDMLVHIVVAAMPEYADDVLPQSYIPLSLHRFRINRHPVLQRFPSPYGNIVSDLDCILWDFVLFSGQRYDKIILVEGDMLLRCPLLEFFGPSLKYPLSGSTVRIGAKANQDWCWYQRANTLVKEKFGDLVASVSPVCGIQMDWDLAVKMANLVVRSNGMFDDMHVELAIGTLARMLGVDPQPTVVPDGFQPEDYIDYDVKRPKIGPWGVFHPVKQLPPTMRLGLDNAPPLTVLTLWRTPWNEAQKQLIDYLAQEDFPDGTQFLWMAEAGTETAGQLNQAVSSAMWAGRNVRLLESSNLSAVSQPELDTQLLNQLLLEVESDELLLVEDDIVAALGDYSALAEIWNQLPVETAACMLGVQSRVRPDCFSAGDNDQDCILLTSPTEDSTKEMKWLGAGYTLFLSADVEACLPLKCEVGHNNCRTTWEFNLSERLRVGRRKVFLAPHVQIHRYPNAAHNVLPKS